jgi:hypothetical protein
VVNSPQLLEAGHYYYSAAKRLLNESWQNEARGIPVRALSFAKGVGTDFAVAFPLGDGRDDSNSGLEIEFSNKEEENNNND